MSEPDPAQTQRAPESVEIVGSLSGLPCAALDARLRRLRWLGCIALGRLLLGSQTSEVLAGCGGPVLVSR